MRNYICFICYLFLVIFILVPIVIYQLINPPCQKNIIKNLDCDSDFSRINNEVVFLKGCKFKTILNTTWECIPEITKNKDYKDCKKNNERHLNKINRNLRAGAGGGGINPSSKKKKSLLVYVYNRSIIKTNDSKISHIPLPDEITKDIIFNDKMKTYLPQKWKGCCENIGETINEQNSILEVTISLLGTFNNNTQSFINNNDSCFNFQNGNIHLWQVNIHKTTMSLLIIILLPIPLIMMSILILLYLNIKEYLKIVYPKIVNNLKKFNITKIISSMYCLQDTKSVDSYNKQKDLQLSKI